MAAERTVPPLTPAQEAYLTDVFRARSGDGAVDGGLERVVKMAQTAALVHNATSLAEIRPDLADEEVAVDPDRTKRRLVRTLIRPTGPRRRLNQVQYVVQRERLGLN
jgi:hypothetical protein